MRRGAFWSIVGHDKVGLLENVFWRFPAALFMRRPVQRKYAAGAAHGPRGEKGKMALPYSIMRALRNF